MRLEATVERPPVALWDEILPRISHEVSLTNNLRMRSNHGKTTHIRIGMKMSGVCFQIERWHHVWSIKCQDLVVALKKGILIHNFVISRASPPHEWESPRWSDCRLGASVYALRIPWLDPQLGYRGTCRHLPNISGPGIKELITPRRLLVLIVLQQCC